MYRSPRVQIVPECHIDKYVITPLKGNRTTYDEYQHHIKMPAYDWKEAADYTMPSSSLEAIAFTCKGDVGFLVAIEEDADADSPLLISYRMAFTDPSDAVLFKLSTPT